MSDRPTVLIMAAGHGTRMRSGTPKVLHPVCGRPMLHWVIEAAWEAEAERVVCVTRADERVPETLPQQVESVEQREGEGTGSAVMAAADRLSGAGTVVVLSADHPLVAGELVRELLEAHARERAAATLLTTEDLDPSGYGRVVRTPDGSVERIVETKHTAGLSEAELAIREINIGAYAFAADELVSALPDIALEHGERYLTGVFPVLRARGRRIATHRTSDTSGAMGVNTRADLMAVERVARERILERHALAGVTFSAPDTVSVDVGVDIGEDTTIAAGVSLTRGTRIGRGCELGPHTTVIGSTLGDGVRVAHSQLVECEVEDGAAVGPFSYLRPGSAIGEGAKVGAFVEVKNSHIGRGAKVPHLSYIGDADVGDEANVGAGNITANYDGREKHRTSIGSRVKTGVDTSFVAPVSVGDGAYTGAGSVITEDVPEGALGIARPEQKNVEGYAERVEKDSSQ